jgi:hypothetical protein
MRLDAMQALCERDDFDLVDTFPHTDITGSKIAPDRATQALEAVERTPAWTRRARAPSPPAAGEPSRGRRSLAQARRRT